MAQTDVGPNDLVIHLVNPYKCGLCGLEFLTRSMLLEHIGEHIDKQKSQNPCNQIVCIVTAAAHTENGITVTRDILQINENQMFELLDPGMDYTHIAPLKALEQAGILVLPQKQILITQGSKDLSIPFIGNNIDNGFGNKLSLLKNQSVSLLQKEPSNLQMEILDPSIIEGQLEDQIEPKPTLMINKPVETNITDIDSIVQQALFSDGKIKEDYSIMIEAPQVLSGQFPNSAGVSSELFVAERTQSYIEAISNHRFPDEAEKSILGKKKKKCQCPVCHMEFPNSTVMERHQANSCHTESRHRCHVCFRKFNDISALRKHLQHHTRHHKCPICHRLFHRKFQLHLHMKQHGKKRFIQFGNTMHEVKIKMFHNDEGQTVQQYSLTMLLDEDEKKEDVQNEANSTDSLEQNLNEDISLSKTNSSVVDTIEQSTLILENKNLEPSQVSDAEDKSNQAQTTVKKKSVIYQCGHCKKNILTRPTLSRHLIKHTNKRPYQCQQCSKTFRDKSDLVHHIRTHTKPIKCQTCTAAFSKTLYLEKHLQKGCPTTINDDRYIVLEDQKCQCKVCGKVLKSKANIIRHLRVHAFEEREKSSCPKSEETQSCAVGTNSDTTSENLEDHYKSLEDSVGFSCLICGQEFRFRSYMKTHILMHLKIKPFKCPECDKRFYARHMMKKHLQNHTRPYTCPVCNKGFIRRYLMKHHFRKKHEEGGDEDMEDITVLEDKKLISCDICGKTMKSYQKSMMKYHVRMHKDVRPFTCTECHKTFISENALKKHSLNHSKPYVCQVCGKGFSRRYLMTDHFEKVCKHLVSVEQSIDSNLLKSTSDNIEENTGTSVENVEGESSLPYQAVIVTKLNSETGKETYTCQDCDKTFTVYQTMLRHINTFARDTKCKHCGKLFHDKHPALVHQRSCLGSNIISKNNHSKATKPIGKRQEVVKKIISEVKNTIDSIISEPQKTSDSLQTSHCDTPHIEISDFDVTKNNSLEETKTVDNFRENKSFPCPQCSKTFTTARGLKIHANSHVRLYTCETCGLDFSQVGLLREHQMLYHKEGNLTEVETISLEMEVNEANNLNTNEETIHVALNDSEIGKEAFEVSEDMSEAGLNNLKTRISTIEEEVANCEMPTEAQIIVEHKDLYSVNQRLMKTGTRGRPFSCKMCRRRFTEQNGLNSHMLKIHGVK